MYSYGIYIYTNVCVCIYIHYEHATLIDMRLVSHRVRCYVVKKRDDAQEEKYEKYDVSWADTSLHTCALYRHEIHKCWRKLELHHSTQEQVEEYVKDKGVGVSDKAELHAM